MSAIFKREFKAYFTSPLGYIYLAAVWFFFGLFFSDAYSAGVPSVPDVILQALTFLTFLIPVIVMRSFSEDRRQKVDQVILTAPIRISSIVFGKYFAAMCMYGISLSPTLIFEMIMKSKVETVSFGSYLYMLFGALLFGSVLITIGMFISTLTESTAVAGMVSEIVSLFFLLLPLISYELNLKVNSLGISAKWLSKVVSWIIHRLIDCADGLAINIRIDNFSNQVFSIADVIYFVSFSVVFLFLCTRSLEKKRWS